MADPLTIIGAAAASAQLIELAAKVLLKTIRFAKELREVPKKLAELLQEVERSTIRVLDLSTVVLKPGSKVLTQLDAVQVDGLARVVTELHQAMDDLNKTLQPLEFQRLGSGMTVRRLWKSVMAIKAEKEVADQLHKVDRLNNEVSRQLGITVLELQATVSGKLDKASATATDGKAEVIGAVETNCRMIEATIQDSHILTTAHLTDIATATRSVQQMVSGARTDISAVNISVTRLAEDVSVRHQMLIDSFAERERRLRDDIIYVLLGRKDNISIESQRTSQDISEAKQGVVQHSVRRELMRCPSSLAEASASLRVRRCRCRPVREFTDTSFWGLSFRAEESNEHWAGCRYAKSGARSWAYSARAALTPFLNLTLELAIGATARGTAWSLASPLRLYATVRRSGSPLFQAFDSLPFSCVESYRVENTRDDVVVKGRPGNTRNVTEFAAVLPHLRTFCGALTNIRSIVPDHHSVYSTIYWHWDSAIHVHWDIDAVKCRLQDLSVQIRRLGQQGVSVGDVDEQGRTILFVSLCAFTTFMLPCSGASSSF